MGNSQPNSPVKNRQGRPNKRLRKQQEPAREVSEEQRGLNHQVERLVKVKGRTRERNKNRTLLNNDAKENNSASRTTKGGISKDQMSDKLSSAKLVHNSGTKSSRLHHGSGQEEKGKVCRSNQSLAAKEMSKQQYKEAFKEESGCSSMGKDRKSVESQKDLSSTLLVNTKTGFKSEGTSKTAVVGMEMAMTESSANLSTFTSLPPLVEQPLHIQSKIGASLEKEATLSGGKSLVGSCGNGTRLEEQRQMNVVLETGEIKVISSVTETEKFSTVGLVDPTTTTTTLPNTLPDLTVCPERGGGGGGALLLKTERGNNNNNSDTDTLQRDYGEDFDDDNKRDCGDDTSNEPEYNDNNKLANFQARMMKFDSRFGSLEEKAEAEEEEDIKTKSVFKSGGSFKEPVISCLNATDKLSSSGHDNLINKSSNDVTAGTQLPPSVVRKNHRKTSNENENNNQMKLTTTTTTTTRRKQLPSLGLNRSISFNTILASSANLLNLSSIVAHMKTRANESSRDSNDNNDNSNSNNNNNSSSFSTTTVKMSSTATRLPAINDTPSSLMVQSRSTPTTTTTSNSLLFRLSSVEDHREKVKNWLESQPLITRTSITSSSSSVDEFKEDGVKRMDSTGGKISDKGQDINAKGRAEENQTGRSGNNRNGPENEIKANSTTSCPPPSQDLESKVVVANLLNRGPIFHENLQEEAVSGLSKLNNNSSNSNCDDDSNVSNCDNNNGNGNNNTANKASPLVTMQTQMTITAINEFSNIMERKLATSIGTSKHTQDIVISSPAKDDSATRSYLELNSNLGVTADDENDLDVTCLERKKKEVDNQVNDDDGNFVIKEEEDEDEDEDDEREEGNKVCMSSKTNDDDDDDEGFCLKTNKIIEVVEKAKSGLCVSRGEDIDGEIVDGQTEVLKKEGGTVIGGGEGGGKGSGKCSVIGRASVCGQVTDKTSSSFSSALCSEPNRDLMLDSSSKRGECLENVRQHLESCSSIQTNIEQQSRKKVDFEGKIGTKEQQVVTDSMMHSGCSLCNYLNSIRVSKHHELGGGEAKNRSAFPSSLNDAASNNAANEREQVEHEEPLKQQQQEENLNCHQTSQQQQVKHGNKFQVSSSIKPRESTELSIWNNLKANLSADMYQYELEANLMIRRLTDEGSGSGVSGCCSRFSSCTKGNDKNNESDIDGSNAQRHNKLHAMNNNKASESLRSNEERNKIDQVLKDEEDDDDDDDCCYSKLVSKASTSSHLGSLDTLADKNSNLTTTISDNKKIVATTASSIASNKQPISYNKRLLKCSTRGLSLDRVDSVNFKGRLVNSRRFLTNQGKSQSTKLILIKSNNAAYTIQAAAAPVDTLNYNVEPSIKDSGHEQGKQQQRQQHQQKDEKQRSQDYENQVKTNGKNLGNQTTSIIKQHTNNEQKSNHLSKTICYDDDKNDGSKALLRREGNNNKSSNNNNEEDDDDDKNSGDNNDNTNNNSNKRLVDPNKQTLNQFGLCKKFLVKKIKPCSNQKFLIRKQQASYRQTFHAPSSNYHQQGSILSKQLLSKQLSTSIINNRSNTINNTSSSRTIACNRSYSTNTIRKNVPSKVCFSTTETNISDESQEIDTELISLSVTTEPQVVGTKKGSFESLLSNEEFEEERRKNLDNKELRRRKQSSDSEFGGEANSGSSSNWELKEENLDLISGDQTRSKMETTIRMNLQNSTAVEDIDAGGSNSIEAARSCAIAAKRLRELVAHLEHGSVPQSILYQTLEYAASVLDSVTMDQISRVSDEEDGDLSEVQSDAVPNEVRKWLETTFTRNSISQKRKSEDKLKFRSVANAIRAGIVVDRIYRRTSACIPFVSAEVSNLLKNIDDWSFDCFSVNQVSNGQVLKSVGYELFNRYGLIYKFKIPTTTLKNFLTQIEMGYVKHKNPYHNNLHAADVTQTVHYMLWQAGLTNWLTDLEIFATLLAAIIHDYLHTGTTNNFHVMSQSDTALIYNDRAVLENFHICQAFTLMKNEDCNILANLSKDEYREFRSLVIDMVLATDMSSHFQQIKAMKNILNHSDNFNADKSKILSLVIHISDISHPAKEWELHSTWTRLLMEEFFRQGDREKELDLECSPLCDRETTLVAESQLGFIEFIVSPSLEVCGDVLDRVHYQMAEANARPVLPASAKAVSMVAASAANQPTAAVGPNKTNQMQAIEGGPSSSVGQTKQSSSVVSNSGEDVESKRNQQQKPPNRASSIADSTSSSISALGSVTSLLSSSNQQQQQQQHQQHAMGPKSPPPSQSSITSSFVSSESITSNLRKMIVSSSATIGRKLNISSSSSLSSQNSTNNNNNNHSQQQSTRIQGQQILTTNKPTTTATPETTIGITTTSIGSSGKQQSENTGGSKSDFETRQANYKHPVIQSDLRPKSAGYSKLRQASSDTSFLRQDDNSSELNQQLSKDTEGNSQSGCNQTVSNQQTSQLSRLTQPEGVIKRSSNSALSTCSQASCPANMQTFKIQRPWIACLERNKKIWHERSITDAQARELKEKLKQQQIDSTPASG